MTYRDKLALLQRDPTDLAVDVPKEDIFNLPFGEYSSFDDCVSKNQEKDDPKAFCGWLKARIEGSNPVGVNQWGGPDEWKGTSDVERMNTSGVDAEIRSGVEQVVHNVLGDAAKDDVKAIHVVGSWVAKAPGRRPDRRGAGTSDIDVMLEPKEGTSTAKLEALAGVLARKGADGRDVHVGFEPIQGRQKGVTVWTAQPVVHLAGCGDAISLPDVADVSFPSVIGAIPAKPSVKKRKRFNYRGVHLSRKPMKFEAKVLSLTEIPRRLDLATVQLVETDTEAQLRETLLDIANYGAREVLREVVRQGAPSRLLRDYPSLAVDSVWSTLTMDRHLELSAARAQIQHKLSQRRLSGDRLMQWTEDLLARRVPAMSKRYAARAVNEAFSFGRTVTIEAFRRVRGFDLAKAYRDENGKFISVLDAVAGGDVLVDAVVQTAVMDTNTCDECDEVDGEVMDFGDARQLELHPPYVKCLGGDRCRCVQIAILDNGDEVDVDEIEEDTLD